MPDRWGFPTEAEYQERLILSFRQRAHRLRREQAESDGRLRDVLDREAAYWERRADLLEEQAT